MGDNIFVFNALFWCALFAYSFIRDRSRYRNCLLLFISIISLIPAISLTAGENSGTVLLIFVVLIILAILVVPFFLVHNGIVMLRKEGRSLANMLSLFTGLGIGLGEIATLVVFINYSFTIGSERTAKAIGDMASIGVYFSSAVIYASLAFLTFMFYSIFLQIVPHKRDFDYVIIHGAGLINGSKVSRLLADRLDKAIEIYHKDPTPPMMIPSGGKGNDESMSEAEAMADYLLEHGVKKEHILMEDQSTTTYENLVNSKKLIESREGRKYTLLVTSNYHVYRALRYCRKIGLKCTGVGSRVALYYWPSALIREFIAIHAEKKHLIIFLVGLVLWLLPAVYLNWPR